MNYDSDVFVWLLRFIFDRSRTNLETKPAVARSLLSEGCRVVLADRNHASIERVTNDLDEDEDDDARKSRYLPVRCDVTDPDQVRDLIRQADGFAGPAATGASSSSSSPPRVDAGATLLVNCAGITRDNWISQMEPEEWDDVLDVNLRGTYLTCRAFLDRARADRLFPEAAHDEHHDTTTRPRSSLPSSGAAASIVNIGSVVSEMGNLGQVNYAASKGGVLGLTRALAREAAIRNVRANTVLPGFVDTPMARAVPPHVRDRVTDRIPLKRFGTASEIADAVSFLLSPRSGYITGESITVSGMISL